MFLSIIGARFLANVSGCIRFFLHSAVLVAGLAALPAGAAVVLTVDVSNPSAVTITAAGGFSSVDDSSTNAYYGGPVLLNLFTQFTGYGGPSIPALGSVSGSLSGTGNATPFGMWEGHDGTVNDHHELWLRGSRSDTEQYSTTAPPFTGTSTINLYQYRLILSPPGSTGSVAIGPSWTATGNNPGFSPVLIGTYVVVPEPGFAACFAAGACCVLGLAISRRRLRRD